MANFSENVSKNASENVSGNASDNLMNLDSCISKLNFIGTIPENTKPCYNTDTLISKNAWFVRIRRRWAGEEGEEGIKYVAKVLDSCDLNYRMCLEDNLGDKNITSNDHIPNLSSLRTALRNSMIGFDNLINTYSDQKKVVDGYMEIKTKILILINNINTYLESLTKPDKPEIELKLDKPEIDEPTKKSSKGLMSYFTGYQDDDYDYDYDYDPNTEKKSVNHMTLSLVRLEDFSSKPSFFGTNGMVFLRPSRSHEGKSNK